MKWIEKDKAFHFTGFKASPIAPTDAQLALINKFTRRPFAADELYIGQLRLANNCIDRDDERYSEGMIGEFARTAVGKTFLMDHGKYESKQNAIGKFFDVEVEKMDLATARAETGEDLRLPEGMTEVQFLSPWFYIPKAGIDERELVKIDAGVYDFTSIGFVCESLVPVADEMGVTLFWEYRGRGETREGSLVYLGAQYGARMKSADGKPEKTANPNDTKDPNEGGKISMKNLAKKLMQAFGKVFTDDDEEKLFDEIKGIVGDRDTKITALTSELKEQKDTVAELTPLAADGKAYRDGLVTEYVTAKAKLGECDEKPESQEALKKVAAGYPIDHLKKEVALLKDRVAEKFPDEPQTKGDMRKDKSADGKEKGWKEKNPLVPEE
jgi:hypothetical protein